MSELTEPENAQNIARVVIVGGGFAGVSCALRLLRCPNNVHVTLISETPYVTYYPALYHVVTGLNPDYAEIPHTEIFGKYLESDAFTLVHDRADRCELSNKIVGTRDGEEYKYDYLVIATGSEAHFFNIEGADEVSFTFQSPAAARHLKKRVYDMASRHLEADLEEMLLALHFVIVGAGPSGVELAGELAGFAREVVKTHNLPESLVTVDLVERNDRVLARMNEKISRSVTKRLRALGVNLLLNRTMIKSESWTVFLKDMTLGAKTLVWTAGSKPNTSTQNIPGLNYSPRGKVVVNSQMEAQGQSGVYIAGDLADVKDSGLAQAAIRHGKYIANNIIRKGKKRLSDPYLPKALPMCIPVGIGWGVFGYKNFSISGFWAWLLRFLIDAKYFASIISIRSVLLRMKMVHMTYRRRAQQLREHRKHNEE